MRIIAGAEIFDALIGRQFHGVAGAHIEGNALEQPLVFFRVRSEQFVEFLFGSGGDLAFDDDFRITAHVLEIFVARCRRDQDRDRIRVRDCYGIRRGADHSPVHQHTGAHLELQRPRDTGHRRIRAAHHQGVSGLGFKDDFLRRRKSGGKRNGFPFVRREPDNDHLIHRAGENLACEPRATFGVFSCGDGSVQIEVAPVIFDGYGVGKAEHQIAGGFIRHLGFGGRDDFCVDQFSGLRIFPIENELADLRQRGLGLRIDGIVRAATPKCVLVQLESLIADVAKDHRAEASIADGQRLFPFDGRLTIPQAQAVARRGRVSDQLRFG